MSNTEKTTPAAPADGQPKFMSFEDMNDIYKALAILPETALPDVSKMPQYMQDYATAQTQLAYVTEAYNLNEDGTRWLPNFSGNEAHYEPWHAIDTKNGTIPSGVGFSASSYVAWHSSSSVGARQIFRSVDRYRQALKKFESVFIRAKLIRQK